MTVPVIPVPVIPRYTFADKEDLHYFDPLRFTEEGIEYWDTGNWKPVDTFLKYIEVIHNYNLVTLPGRYLWHLWTKRGIMAQEYPFLITTGPRTVTLSSTYDSYWRTRHRAIFATFQADSNGIAHVVGHCSGPEAETMTFDPNTTEELRGSGYMMFPVRLPMAQEKLGVRLFDMEMIESGQWLRSQQVHGGMRATYEVFIDERNSMVYLMVVELRAD